MNMSTEKRFLFAFLFAGSVSLVADLPAYLRIPSAFLQVFYLPGTVFMTFIWNRERSYLDNILLPPILSPIVLTFLVFFIHLFTGSLAGSLKIAVLAMYALLAIALVKETRAGTGDGVYSRTEPSILFVSAAFAGLIAVSYAVNSYLIMRSDAWLHASITNEILMRGIPPLEPMLPDVSIRYMWFYHLFQASWTSLSEMNVFRAMSVSNIVFAFIYPYLICRLVSLFTDRKRHLVLIPLFTIAGLQSPSWLLWPLNFARVLVGEVRGMAEIKRIIASVDINSHRVIFALRAPFTFLGNPIDKFYTTTSFNYGFCLFVLIVIVISSAVVREKSRIRAAFIIFVLIYGLFLFHLVTGVLTIITVCGAGIYLMLTSPGTRLRIRGFGTLAVPAVAVAAGLAGLPYFFSLTSGESGTEFSALNNLHIGLINIFTIAAPVILLWPFIRRAAKWLLSSDSEDRRFYAGAITALLIANLFIDLPGEVEGKVVFLLFILMVFPVSMMIIDSFHISSGAKRAWLAVMLLFFFIIPPVLTFRGFILDRPRGIGKTRVVIDRDQGEIFRWIKDNTPVNAVMIENNSYGMMPVHALRREFATSEAFCLVQGYGGEKVLGYTKMRDALFAGDSLSEGDLYELRRLGLDLYLVVWQEDIVADRDLISRLESDPGRFEKVFGNSAGIVYSLSLE